MDDETVELAFDVFDDEETDPALYPVIMMHGVSFNKEVMAGLARGLAQSTHRRVYSLDLRNHGESPEVKNFSYTIMIEDVKRFIKEQELKKFSFVCHSFSGTIAYIISLDMPDAVEKIVIVDSPPFNENNEEFNEINAYPTVNLHLKLLKLLNSNMSLQDARSKFLRLAQGTEKGKRVFYEKAASDLILKDGEFNFRHDYVYMGEQYKKGLVTLKPRGSSDKDILIIRCPNSVQVWDAKFEAVKRHNPRAQLLTFENTSHLLLFEEPEKFIQATAEFLRTPT